jgi:DNA-binding transcriptional regulator YiaG
VRVLDRISVMTDNSSRRRSPLDDLDRSIARRTSKNARYPELLQAEVRRQRLIAALVEERKANHLTQAQVAAEMNVSQSVVAEIESSKADARPLRRGGHEAQEAPRPHAGIEAVPQRRFGLLDEFVRDRLAIAVGHVRVRY